jgi:hypothetical protein
LARGNHECLAVCSRECGVKYRSLYLVRYILTSQYPWHRYIRNYWYTSSELSKYTAVINVKATRTFQYHLYDRERPLFGVKLYSSTIPESHHSA